jgi:ubiquinone/menaquinone biosynthesis C-methylase UbiE
MTANEQGGSSSYPRNDPRAPADPANTYVFGIEHLNSEMARLMGQDQVCNSYIPLIPPGVTLPASGRVLDVACGPGGWAMELAFHYPEMRVVGVDINEQLIDYAQAMARVQGLDNVTFRPMNVTLGFDQTDALQELPQEEEVGPQASNEGTARDHRVHPYGLDFPADSFDFVNARLLGGILKRGWWQKLIREMVRVTCPGGVIRLTEANGHDIFITTSPAIQHYQEILRTAFERDQRLSMMTAHLRPWLMEAGCYEVQMAPYCIEYYYGSKEYEAMHRNLEVMLYQFMHFALKMDPSLTREDLEQLYRQCLIEMGQPDFSGQWLFVSVWGRKSAG